LAAITTDRSGAGLGGALDEEDVGLLAALEDAELGVDRGVVGDQPVGAGMRSPGTALDAEPGGPALILAEGLVDRAECEREVRGWCGSVHAKCSKRSEEGRTTSPRDVVVIRRLLSLGSIAVIARNQPDGSPSASATAFMDTWASTPRRSAAASTIPDGFWMEQTPWCTGSAAHARPRRLQPPLYRWFPDGTLNTCFNALDRHVAAGRGEQVALIYDSPVTGSQQSFTYERLTERVAASPAPCGSSAWPRGTGC
jgi:hypothetical protein